MYFMNSLHQLQHKLPKRLQHAPHRHSKPLYGSKVQYAKDQDETTILYLPESSTELIQKIIGIFLYCGIAIDLTMLVSLGTLAYQQLQPTEGMWDNSTWFLNYAVTHPNANIYFSKSDTILYVASDGS